MKFNILIFDDEILVCNSMKRILANDNLQITTVTNLKNAREILKKEPIDLVLLDYNLGKTDGLTVLKEIHKKYPGILIVMLTAYATVNLAVSAMKSGAFDFLQKGEDENYILFTVQRALDTLKLIKEVNLLRARCLKESKLPDLIYNSKVMQQIIELSTDFAQTDSTILLTGETGTGKSLLAKYIHHKSNRFHNTIITINCAAIPSELLESELFGYEKGAFTDAKHKGKQGLIEQAHGGTLFLDEIGEMSLQMQSKLLHVLEHSEFYKVGATQPTKVDVRIITATNKNLNEALESKQFRTDLYYRLNVARINIPPLRERKKDILPLVKIFIGEYNKTFNKSVESIDLDVELFLLSSPWVGNIRELKNYIERKMLLAKTDNLMLDDYYSSTESNGNEYLPQTGIFSLNLNPEPETNLFHLSRKLLIKQALAQTENNRSQAAKLLGIPRTSLNHYIKKYSLS